MSEKIVTRVLPKLKVTRTSYLAKESFLTNLEGKSRKLFSPESVSLGHTAAANYLRGPQGGKTAFEIIVSPEETKFLQSLGSSPKENFQQIVFASRLAMDKLLTEVNAENACWVGVFHQNTDHTHLHILIAEEFSDEKGNERSIRRIPKNLLYKDEENLSALDRKFLKAFKEHFIVKPLDSPTIINAEARDFLPPLAEKYQAEAMVAIMSRFPFSLSTLNQASENGSLVSDDNARPVFVRRNDEGIATGSVWYDEEANFWRRKVFENGGWFYIGDLRQAESFILVSTPDEALALQTLHSDRNLEKAAIIALEPRKMDAELGDLLIERQGKLRLQNKQLNVVWATNLNPKGRQIQTGLLELKNYTEKKLRFENLPPLRFIPYSRNSSWTKQLQIVTDAAEIINIIEPHQKIKKISIPQDIIFTQPLPPRPKTEISQIEIENSQLKQLESVTNSEDKTLEKLSFAELTQRARNVSLEVVAKIHGLRETLENGELFWQDSAGTRSIKITDNIFSDRKNKMRGGSGAIDFVAYLQDLAPAEAFKAARGWLIDNYDLTAEPGEVNNKTANPGEQKDLIMPLKVTENIEYVRFYLEESRGIDYQTINKFIENDLLYANSFASAVFVQRDLAGFINGASWRDTTGGSTLRGTAPGSDQENGYFYVGNPNTAERFILVEEPIDLLSYYEIELTNGVDLSKTAIISLGGLNVTPNLLRHLSDRQIALSEQNKTIEIIFATDDDSRGEKAIDRFLDKFAEVAPDLFASDAEEIEEKVNLTRLVPPEGKDWNHYLQYIKDKLEYPTLEEINEHLSEAQIDPTENFRANTENLELGENLSPDRNEVSITEPLIEEEQRGETANEHQPIENGEPTPRLAADGTRLSGGINSESLQTGESRRDTGTDLSESGGESGTQVSGSPERLFNPLGSDGIGESGDQANPGSGGLGTELTDEKVYKFKIRPQGDEFLEYKIGLNNHGEWQTSASGLIGSKDQTEKKVQFIELEAETKANEKLESISQAIEQINAQIRVLDNNRNEYSPLYQEIYLFHQDFLEKFTPQIDLAKEVLPSDIRNVYQKEEGFKVVFQDQKYTRSFSFRDENGSILDRESVREKAATWRKECEKRSAIINDSAEYTKDFESIVIFNEGKNKLQAKIVFDEFDNLWRGVAEGEVFSGVHQFRLTDKPVTFLHQGFADKNKLLSNLILKVTDNLENRINLISKEAETKMFQSAILGLELKRNEFLGIEFEEIKDEAIQPDQTFTEEENQTIFVDDGNRTKQNIGFRRSGNGEIQIQNIQSIKGEGLTVLELPAFDESLANPILDYLENGEIKTRLWFTDAENLRQPLITLSDLPTAENQIVVLQKTNNPFSLTQYYDLPTLRRINLAAARDAEIRAFDLETTAIAVQKVKGEIFYSSLIKETSERLYDNLFGLLGENEQLTVLAEIENQLKDFGFDSIVNTAKQNGKEINFLRVLAGNWTSIGRLTGKTLDLVLDEEIASNNQVQYRKLEDGLTSEIGDYTLFQIFRYDGNPALRAGVKTDIQAWTVYLAGTGEQLENLRKFALEEYQTELKFEPLLEERELKYAQTFDKKPFDLSLDDYIAKREFTAILRIQSEINSLRERNADILNLDKPNFRQKNEIQQNEILLNHYFDQLEKNEVVSDDNRQTFANEYVIAVNRAIKQGLVTPSRQAELAQENPLFKKSVENRQRVEKGKTIAYLKETASLDYSLQDEFGVTIRRQDNQTLAAAQKQEIKGAIIELETVFGSLKEIFTKGEISIVHTSGKQPATSTKTNELLIGVKINGIEQRKFASYFAQWLDREAGSPIGGNDLKASFSEIETSPSKLDDQFSVIKEAWKLSRKQEIYGVNTFKDVSINKPNDIFARLVEQYISTKLENPQFVVENDYSEKFGYWSKQNFAKLIPEIEAEINKRLGLVEKSLNLENLQKFAALSNELALSLAENYQEEENPIPEIDLSAYRQATDEDRNYFEDENNFSPEEVRVDYFQETFALADSVLSLREALKVIPTSKSGEREQKKNQEKLKFDEGNLSFHVFQTGKYFGELSEDYLRRELLKKNIEFTDDYKLVIGQRERVDLLEIKQKEKETSFKPDLFQVEFKEFFEKDSRYQLSSYRHQGTIAGIPPLDGLQITRDSKPKYVITPNQNGDWRVESVREKAGKQVYGLLINGMERIRKVFGHCAALENIEDNQQEQTIPQTSIEKNEAFAAELQNRLGDSYKVEAGLETDSINADVYSIEELFSVFPSEANTLVTVFGYDSGDFYTPPDWIEKYSTEFTSLDEAVLRIKAKTVFDEKAFQQQIINELKNNNIELLFNRELNPDRNEAKVNFDLEVQSLINSKIENDFRYQFLKTEEINQLFLEFESSTIQSNEMLLSEEGFNLQENNDLVPQSSQTINDSNILEDERPIFEVLSSEPNQNLSENTHIESLTEIIKQKGLKKREFAELHNLSGGILYNLEFRVMEFETIPRQFIAKIAQAVNVSQSALEDYLKLPNSGLPLESLSFTEAIRNDEGLTAQIKQTYLNFASPESNTEVIKNAVNLDKPFILNEKEQQVFISLTEEILASTGGQFGYAGDARIPAGMTSRQFAGYISQLTQKGFFDISDDEFKQLTIGENFKGYANQNNLFVGETFENGFDWIEIKGTQGQISQIQEVNTAASESKAAQKIKTLEFDFPADFHQSYTPDNGYKKQTFNGTITSITVKPAANHNYGGIIPTPEPTNDLFYTINVQTNEFPKFQHRIIFNGQQQANALELIKNNTLAIGSEIGFTAYINEGLEKRLLERGSGSLPTNILSISYLEQEIEIEKRGENTQVNAPATIIKPLEEVPLEEIPTENLRAERKPLLLPDVFDVSFGELETYQRIAAQLDFHGFETLQLSGKTIAVKTVPVNYVEEENSPRELVLEYIRNPHLLTEMPLLSPFESYSAVVSDTQNTVNQKMKELMKLPLADRVLVINSPTEYISLFESEALVENGGSGISSVKGFDVEMDADWINSNVSKIELNNVSQMLADDILSLTRENLVDKLEIIRNGEQIFYFEPVEEDQKLLELLNTAESQRTEFKPTENKSAEIIDSPSPSIEKQRIKWGSKILPDFLLNQMPVQQKRETVDDYEVYAKLFHPLSTWTMFVTEAEAVRDENEKIVDVNLFGFVHTDGINDEWGYSSLKEIDETTVRGLKTERDLYFESGRFEDVWRQFRKERGMFDEEESPAKEIAEIAEIAETDKSPAGAKKNELFFESIEITFSESPEIEEGKYFLSVEDFDEFLARAEPPETPELYYKTDFIVTFSDGSRFDGKLDLQRGQNFTLEQIIREDLESAKTVLNNFPNGLEEQNTLQERIRLNENFLQAIELKISKPSQFVDFTQFLPEEITQHLESNRPFSISRRNSDNTRIQVERFITENQNSVNISRTLNDGSGKQLIFAYDQAKNRFFFDKVFTLENGKIIDKSSSPSEAQAVISSLELLKASEKAEVKSTLNQYRITDLELHDSGLKTKFRNNVEAIKLLRLIEEENRLASTEEQEVLAKFSGWGGLKNAFDVYQPKEDWKNEIKELQILLTDNDEYFAARQSTENAHYTSAEFAGEMWKIAQKLGFSGGRILEPAVGDGIFIGTMPEELSASSKVIAVEKEAYSARLTKQLYQRSEVINSGFEKTSLKDNSFDLVISNFPFGSYTVHDPAYNSMSPSIHDYFFLKSLDKVKEGGLVIALTSRFTMDKTDSSIRQAIARRAELVAAYRLPETAFQDNAHTSVVTDLLIFQKRPKGQEIDKEQIENLNWIKSDLWQLDDETYHNVNQYFHENPNHIWGKTSSEGRMYGRNELTVKSENKDEYLAFAKPARENLETVFTSNPIEVNEIDEQGLVFSDHSDQKIGSLFITNSRAYRQSKDGAVELYLTPKEMEKASALIEVRETIKSIYKTEIANEDAEEQRAALNRQYDAFRQKYGIINRPDNLRLLEGDPEIYLVKTLESYFDVKTGRAEKAEVFFQSTLKGYEKPESADNITQALAISLNETGKVNLERIAELLSVTDETVISEIKEGNRAFLNPATKEWDLAEKYLSGNVRQKLAEAKETASISAENEVLYRQNIEELTRVQPKDLDYLEIEPVIGAPWIPKSDIKDFLLHLTKADESAIRLENAAATGQWAVSWSGNASSKSAKQKDQVTKIWGTGRADTIKIVQAALDGRPLHITDTHSDGDKKITVTNVAETELANQKLMEVKQEFKDWIWSDPARRNRLHRDYNDNYNNFVERKYDGSHLTLPNSNPNIILRPHQKDAVWRAMQEPTVYFGHEVGTGKTLVLGASMIEKKRLGQVRKPVIPCLKANIKQVTQQIQELYPTARIFSGDGAFEAENRKTEIAALANNNYDLIILSYNQFDSIPIGKETQKKYIKSELSVLEQSIAFAYESEGKKSRLVSKLNKRSAALETQLEKVLAKPKDDVLEFEETGIDYIAIDECFTYETLIETDQGKLPIGRIVEEKLKVKVLCFNRVTGDLEYKKVVRWLPKKLEGSLVEVKHLKGSFVCTPNHKIWTEKGYVEAGQLQSSDHLFMVQEGVPCPFCLSKQKETLLEGMLRPQSESEGNHLGLRMVQNDICSIRYLPGTKSQILRQDLFGEMEMGTTRFTGKDRFQIEGSRSIGIKTPSILRANESQQSDEKQRSVGKDEKILVGKNFFSQRRKREINPATAAFSREIGQFTNGVRHPDCTCQKSISLSTFSLQSGNSHSKSKNSHRNRRQLAQAQEMEIFGQTQNRSVECVRVESVTVLERGSDQQSTGLPGKSEMVYDLEVADHHNYFANGINVSNCHNFKSLPIYTTMNGIKGIPTSRSDRATNMQMRTEFLREKHGGGRLIMASGTPVTNTVAELYNVMVFTMPETLEKRNIRNFDDFARSYTEIVTKIEPTVTGEYKEQSRLAKFINTPELRALAGNVLDIVKAEDAGVIRPERQDIVISVPISQEQIEYRDSLKERAFNMKKVDPWVDNHLKLMNDGRLMSLDMRLVDEGAEDDPYSKVNYLVANVLRIAEEKQGATQLIFSNLGIHENALTGHSVFNDVVSKLAEGGIPRTRIANFAKLSPTKRKEAIEKLNSGEILVALGSTETLGTGVNAQKFIAAAHNLDVPWLPSAVEQRDGRSVRNGNIFAELDEDIELYRYVTVGSFDELGWTIIDRKMNFINQIVTNNLNGQRTFEEPDSEEFSAAQISAIASGNPDVMKRIELHDNIKRLESMEKRHKQTNLELADEIPGKEAFLESRKSYTEKLELDYELYRTKRTEAGDKFKITLDGQEYTEIDKVSRIFAKEMQTCTKRKEIGEFYGFTVVVEQRTGAGWSLRYPSIALESPKTNLGYDFKTDDPEEIASSMSGQLARLKRAAESNKMTYSKNEKELDAIKEQVSRPFRFSEELKEAREEIKEVDERLKNWKEEQAKMEEVKAELKVTVLQGEAEDKAQVIKEKLMEMIEERPKIEVAPFISKDHTEALIKGVEASVIIAQNANRRETEIMVEDELDEPEIQPGLFSTVEKIDNKSEVKTNNDLFSVVEEKDENPKPQEPPLNNEKNNIEVKEDESKKDSPTEKVNNPTEKSDKVGLSDEDFSRLQAQIIVAQADLSEIKYDAKIYDLREAVGKRFEVFADALNKEKPIDRIEFLRLDSTNKSLITETDKTENPNLWSLSDVGEMRQILKDSLAFIENQQKEQNQEKWRNEENLKNLFENHFNPFKMVKNQLNTLTPEGMVNNFRLNLNPLASIENHPVIQLVKSINDAQNAHQKGLLLEKTNGEISEKLETLETNISRQVVDWIDLQKQEQRTSIDGKEKEIAALKAYLPEGVQVKANFTTEELERVGVVALKTSNHSLMYEYQKAVVEKAETLETDKLRFQAVFENKDIDKYATRSMLELEKTDVTQQQAANLIRRGGVQPKNLLDAFKQLADLQGNGKSEELIEAHRNLGKEKFSPIETFDKSDLFSHLEGQKLIANAHQNELKSEFKQRFIDGGIKSEPILVSVNIPLEENEIQKSLSKPVWQGESDPLLQAQKQQAIEGMKNQAADLISDAKRMSDYLNELSVSFRDDLIKAGANKNLMPQISQKEAELVDFNKIEGKVNVYDAPLIQMLETQQEINKPQELNQPVQPFKNLEQETTAKAAAQVVEMQEESIAEEAGMLFL